MAIPTAERTRERHFAKAREIERRRRPVAAVLSITDGTAAVRLVSQGHRVTIGAHHITLPGHWDYIQGPLLTAAEDAIRAAGFRLDGGWDEQDWDAGKTRTLIDVTPEYLAYVDRKFNPAPPLGARPAGVTAHRDGFHSWQLCYQNRRFFTLTYRPKMTGPEWGLSSLSSSRTTEHVTAQEAMAAAVARVAKSDAPRAAN